MRALRDWLKRRLRTAFEVGQRFGVDILPHHFYSSIPDIRALRETEDWRKPLPMCGVSGTELAEQIDFLKDLVPPPLISQWSALDVHRKAVNENGEGGGYGPIEAEVLHAFVRRYRPPRIVQIGCGVSTSVILRAAESAEYRPHVTCIEPYPSPFLRSAEKNGRISLVRQGAQEVPRELMTELNAGDLLFVDSTHTVKPGGEVNRIVLNILPRLSSGVFVHFHDIYFPYDYQRHILDEELFFHTESTLLHAFLIHNARCRIVLSLSMLHYGAPAEMVALFPAYDPQENAEGLAMPGGVHFPSATYLLTMDAPQ